jgi:predicted nucleic acid-binding protein
MPEKILVDLNVILDVLLERNGFIASRKILELSERNSNELYISAHLVTTFAYLLESSNIPRTQIRIHIKWLIETFNIVTVDNIILKNALKSRIKDYEDAVIEQTAILCSATTIITRNVKDFSSSTVPALLPEKYLTS